MGNMLKVPYQQTAGYRIYEAWSKIAGNKPLMSFLFMFAFMTMLQDVLFAASEIGMDAQGNIRPTDFTKTETKDFAKNLGLSFTAIRVVGTVIIAGGLVMTAIRYRAEEQAQRAQELLIRGGLALLIVNILPTIISFVAGAFESGGFLSN